ncbi:bifunctional folylpolyglutamate synthase/dihydrofolate synthase [Ilyobacter polytropus]|uniref:tetrahydrofolate synthase n=1 Tax=Ilyobacter polytropus (strain ATCC 51220 / DSM 2926 / LMG 16218 / CuHBu1) TaxID=572544 RepID=E3H7P2_ILYPC|nr:folylpolyglutamate synthase/dihydrofolate synthase family protein [Ilyobacter polytropus]ADO82624.1 FolC bifunctional protein [Ilyobacter polytropus DSM 2926]
MDTNKILDELYSYSMFGIKLGLENIERMCEALGNPQDKYRVIHIAGTNGKGSTATTIEAGLIEAGYRVGKFTSPHIIRFNERIQFGGNEIEDQEICSYYLKVKEVVEEKRIKATFFEMTTAMMFLYFADKKAEFVVLETGMGGRYDATNVVNSEIAVITNVSLDHVGFLGDNIYDISKEKAGIIKKKCIVVVGDDNLDFIKAIRNETENFVNIKSKYKNIEYTLDKENFLTEINIENKKYSFSLFGEYQVGNFLCAYETLKILGIESEVIQRAAAKVRWPGRFEVYSKTPLVILDGAHNADAAEKLRENLNLSFSPEEVVAVVSVLDDKDIPNIMREIRGFSDTIILTSLEMFKRGLKGEELSVYTDSFKLSLIENDIKEAYKKAFFMDKKVIVICGSFYLLSRFKQEA